METTYLMNSIWVLCASVFVFMMAADGLRLLRERICERKERM